MPYPINPAHRLTLEDGTSFLLLEDNSSKVILDEQIALDDPLNAATVTTLTPALDFTGSILPQYPTISLTDTFNSYSGSGASFGGWTYGGGNNNFVVFNNDVVTLLSQITSQYSGIFTTSAYPLKGTSAFVEVKSVGDQTIASHETIFYVDQDTAGAEDANNKIYITCAANTINVRQVIAGVNTQVANTAGVTYNPVSHRWWRIREYSGTTYIDFSPDGITWTNQWNFSNLIVVTNNHFSIQEGTFSSETFTTKSVFDNFNVLPRLTYEVEVDTVNTFNSTAGFNGIIDSYSETNQDSNWTMDNSGFLQSTSGQSFTGDGNILKTSQFYLKTAGSPTGNVVSRVYAHSGTFGTSSVTTGSALATSDNVTATTITSGYTLITFNFSGVNQITLTNGTHYVVTVEYNGSATQILVGSDTSSPSHSGNASSSSSVNSGTSSASATIDLIFYVETTSIPASPLIDKTSDINTGFVDDTTTALGDDSLMLEDGTSHLLLEDNSSFLKINYSYPTPDYITYTVPAGVLSNSTTYYWRARQKVQNGGSYTGWSEVRSFIPSTGSTISVSDSTTVAETITAGELSFVSVPDSTTVSETLTELLISFVSVSDSSTVSETITLNAIEFISVSDSSTVSETLTMLASEFVGVSDSTTVSETLTIGILALFSVSDSTVTSESLNLLSIELISVSDNTTTSETVTLVVPLYLVSASDSITTSETLTPLNIEFIGVSDSTTLTESITLTYVGLISVSDSTVVSENIKLLVDQNIVVSDATTSSETIPTPMISYGVAVVPASAAYFINGVKVI